ncbi:hypothetical protein [Paenibacillus sp. MSJ-34]|uniref:hypothetical protein n=1 Tax=Paenibacillus sp. MSJ-34 TaxID=2841529 RepID=UPI001C1156B4|nr:hypothetical protein [Paenibacillus sp. MSJ-34]MBU5441211.1 hypothetical protein [Paenibacillus sp. MSJ-34]
MRDGIRQRLIDAIPEIDGQVYEPHAAGADTPKPYIVIVQGVDAAESDWAGFRRIIEIWPYVNRTSFSEVDEIERAIVSALHEQVITDLETGEVFTCLYQGATGSDMVDEEWDAITRGLRFSVMAIQPVGVPETVANDPWLEALAEWTGSTLPDWSVYRNAWPLGYKRPSVMWRIAGIPETRSINRAAYEVRKQFVGHVIGQTQNEQSAALLMVAETLTSAIKIPLNLADRQYMTVMQLRVNSQADALSTGQVTMTLSRKMMREFEEAPKMAQVQFDPNIR